MTEQILDEYRAADSVGRNALWVVCPDLCVQFGVIDAGLERQRAVPPWSWDAERAELARLAKRLTSEQAVEIVKQLVQRPDERRIPAVLVGMIAGYCKNAD